MPRIHSPGSKCAIVKVGSARVESQDWFSAGPVEYSARQPSPPDSVFHGAGSLSAPAPNVLAVAELVRYSDPAHATALEGLAYPLLTEAEAFDWQTGPPAQPLCPGPGCIGRLALPFIPSAERIEGNVSESNAGATEIAIQDLVPQAGLTNTAVFLYDQNGLLDILCQALNSQQVEYIDLATWGYVNPGFRGSAVISATAWDHPAFDPAGTPRPPSGGTAPRRGAGGQVNPVGLAGVIIERSRTDAFDSPGDGSAGSIAFPLTIPFHPGDLTPPEDPTPPECP